MFFMTRKRFEEEVMKRIEDWQRREDHERELRRVYESLFKLEERMTRLEGKELFKATQVEVCTVKTA